MPCFEMRSAQRESAVCTGKEAVVETETEEGANWQGTPQNGMREPEEAREGEGEGAQGQGELVYAGRARKRPEVKP